MIKPTRAALTLFAIAMSLPLTAQAGTLSLPAGATVSVEVIDTLTLDQSTTSQADVLLKPTRAASGEYDLPNHCLITADARLNGEHIRLSASTLTCIEATADEREIFSGEFSASAEDLDGNTGVPACVEGSGSDCRRAELLPGDVFQLRLRSELDLEAQENPSAQINERRRQANGEGVANPVPAERPDPDDQ
ncbi:hypothetical protein IEI94_09730 [Halomonas sp. ML-15]|uniref:hypothetical protein n=1 Tax=Halomonas sp. ML-15 TaxID=2773305 RepID=UPI001745EE06|nr:hypothetical protein [Halomonas sp. ML-15]MBD3896130.1 hypothetical protein [Halomonas sp. ML-15]